MSRSSHFAAWLIIAAASAGAYLAFPRLIWRFRRRAGYWPNAGLPRTFQEKMLWRKVFDRNPLFAIACDKLRVKDFARERCRGVRIPKTLWEGRNIDDIPASLLAGSFAAKPNNQSGSVLLVVNGKTDKEKLRAELERWLDVAYSQKDSEWGYPQTTKILVEELVTENGAPVQTELKFHLFGGRVFLCNMILNRSGGARSCAFDREGNRIGEIGIYGGAASDPLPAIYPRAVAMAEELCSGFDYIRCDFYVSGDNIWLGELTVYPLAGYTNFKSSEIMTEMAARWDLKQSWFLSRPQTGLAGLYARSLRSRLSN